MGEMPEDPAVSTITSATVARLTDAVTLIAELMIGYRTQLLTGGFGETVVDDLVREFHHVAMETMMS